MQGCAAGPLRYIMNILYYDCFSGISGDMNMAAMIDLGVDPHYLKAELDKLGLGAEFELKVSTCACSGIKGTQVHVCQDGKPYHARGHAHNLAHDLAHDHDHDHAAEHHCEHAGHAEHPHAHDHAVANAARHEHHHAQHRNLAAIEAIIMSSGLKPEVKQTSLRIFGLIAKAEAKVHGKPVSEVHFHEVGATDSIVDIVGAAICFHALRVDAVWASAIELGSGLVHCAHGVMPVPAPATAEIVHGLPTTRGGTDHEATTPTGAAIIAALTSRFTSTPAMSTSKTGYGIGHRQSSRPNMLRVYLASDDCPAHI